MIPDLFWYLVGFGILVFLFYAGVGLAEYLSKKQPKDLS